MSETVHYTGKIKKLDFGDLTEDEIRLVLEKRNFSIPKYRHDMEEIEGLLILNGKYYEEIEKKQLSDGDIFHAEKNGDEINFSVQYYNGSCSFVEALEEALDDAKIE